MAFSEQVKLSVRKKSLGRCCICWEPFVDVHHIIPQAEGGPDTEENAAPLCQNCHGRYGDNPNKRKAIREFRDNWYERCAARPLLVQFIVEETESTPKLETFDDLERHVLDLSTTAPMAAFLQLYDAIEQQIKIFGKAVGIERTEVWNLAVGVMLLKGHLAEPHAVVEKLLSILENYAQLYDKTIMPEADDEPLTDQDILSSVALGLKLPRLIRDSLRYIPFDDEKPKAWPIVAEASGPPRPPARGQPDI